jgi:hypothetical protein
MEVGSNPLSNIYPVEWTAKLRENLKLDEKKSRHPEQLASSFCYIESPNIIIFARRWKKTYKDKLHVCHWNVSEMFHINSTIPKRWVDRMRFGCLSASHKPCYIPKTQNMAQCVTHFFSSQMMAQTICQQFPPMLQQIPPSISQCHTSNSTLALSDHQKHGFTKYLYTKMMRSNVGSWTVFSWNKFLKLHKYSQILPLLNLKKTNLNLLA